MDLSIWIACGCLCIAWCAGLEAKATRKLMEQQHSEHMKQMEFIKDALLIIIRK